MKTDLKSSVSSNFPPLHWKNPAKRRTVSQTFTYVLTSFNRQNDVTPSIAMIDVIFAVAIDVTPSARFQNCELLFDITQFVSIGYIGEVYSNLRYTVEIRRHEQRRLRFVNVVVFRTLTHLTFSRQMACCYPRPYARALETESCSNHIRSLCEAGTNVW